MGALKLNLGQSGFYRVAYGASERARLKPAIPNMDEVDRVGIVSDAFACGASGYASTVDALELLDAYRADTSYVVWSDVASGLGGLTAAFFEQPDDIAEALRVVRREPVRAAVERSGGKGRLGGRSAS